MKKKAPRVSVLIVAHNSGSYIRSTLNSILDQSFGDFEILILDNASVDGTADTIASYEDSRITLIRSDINTGPYGGMNILLSHARGEYIAVQDHDDIWHPEKLSNQVEYMDNNPDSIGCGTAVFMYYESDQKGFIYRLPSSSYYALHPSLLFRAHPDFRYDTNLDYMADALFQKKQLCFGGKKIANLNTVLTLHLIKGSQGNYSYRWFKLSLPHVKRVFLVHGYSIYTGLILAFEILRKILYPVLQKVGAGKYISMIEKIPFLLMGNKFFSTSKGEVLEPSCKTLIKYLR